MHLYRLRVFSLKSSVNVVKETSNYCWSWFWEQCTHRAHFSECSCTQCLPEVGANMFTDCTLSTSSISLNYVLRKSTKLVQSLIFIARQHSEAVAVRYVRNDFWQINYDRSYVPRSYRDTGEINSNTTELAVLKKNAAKIHKNLGSAETYKNLNKNWWCASLCISSCTITAVHHTAQNR